jgi:shikimate dehydrogenase
MTARRFGLIGFPLGHSFSKKYFTEKFEREQISDCTYSNFPIESIDTFPTLLSKEQNLVGVNVTIPYKQQVLAHLDALDPVAAAIGAVNTIHVTKAGLKGYNTDAFGFQQSLKPFLKSTHERALVLGTGGASKAVAYVLKSIGVQVIFVSRTPNGHDQMGYADVNEHVLAACKLVVNTTPLGTHPNVDACPPLPYHQLTAEHHLYDLVYNPAETLFLQQGKAQGASIQNGLDMLKLQAEQAWKIWNSEN